MGARSLLSRSSYTKLLVGLLPFFRKVGSLSNACYLVFCLRWDYYSSDCLLSSFLLFRTRCVRRFMASFCMCLMSVLISLGGI